MDKFLQLIAQHGYSMVFLAVLAESIGLPVPAALAMIAGGAAAALGILSLPLVFLVCMVAMLWGDLIIFFLGRYMGWYLLGMLCRLSLNPETCILRSAESFYKRGRATLLIAKFIPGIGTMAAPLAGSMKMKTSQFLLYDFAGAAMYALVYVLLGLAFHDFLSLIVRGFATAGHLLETVTVIAVLAYIAYRIWLYWKHRIYRVVPRVQVTELTDKLKSGGSNKIVVADVRSHGYYDAGAERIHGSVRLEPNNLDQAIKDLPSDVDIYLYCT